MSQIIDELEKNGYAVLEDVFTEQECSNLGRHLDYLENVCLNSRSGFLLDGKYNRQRQLLNVHYLLPKIFLSYISNYKILEVVASVLKDKFILSNFNASRAMRNDCENYRIHIDSRKPNPVFANTYQIVANICIDDFTEFNGSTVVVRSSHKSGMDPRNLKVTEDEVTKVIAPKGSVAFLLGQTWHDVGHNIDGARRWSIIAYYSCWWIKPTYDFVGACTEEIFNLSDAKQKELLGFTSRPPKNWDKRQKTVTNVSDIPNSFIEALDVY